MDTLTLFAAGAMALLVALIAAGAILKTWPRLGVILLAFSIYLNHYKYPVGPVKIRAEQVVILMLFGALILRFLVYGDVPRVSIPGLYAIGWWLALGFSAFLHAPHLGETLRHIIRLGLMVVGLIVTVNLVRREEDWRRLVRLLYLAGVLEAAYGILARTLYGWRLGFLTHGKAINLGVQVATSLPVPVPYGTLEEGNIFGSTMAALLMLGLALWVHPKEIASRRLTGLGVGLITVAWLLSLTRGAWLAVIVLLPLFWVLYPTRVERRFAHLGVLVLAAPLALAALLALILFAPPTFPIVSRLQSLTQLNVDQTFSLRVLRWRLAQQDILMRPFIGWGPGTFAQLHGLQRSRPAWLDSLTIKSAQEGGLFGMIFMYGLWATTLLDGFRAALRQPDQPYRGTVLGLTFGALALFLAYHATDATWLAFMWVWLGALIARPGGMWAQGGREVAR